eukprot:1155040-Lingulodinium_polyedra.AAC.1
MLSRTTGISGARSRSSWARCSARRPSWLGKSTACAASSSPRQRKAWWPRAGTWRRRRPPTPPTP